jgi:hypothetical protein
MFPPRTAALPYRKPASPGTSSNIYLLWERIKDALYYAPLQTLYIRLKRRKVFTKQKPVVTFAAWTFIPEERGPGTHWIGYWEDAEQIWNLQTKKSLPLPKIETRFPCRPARRFP